jgi:hypothetical protein
MWAQRLGVDVEVFGREGRVFRPIPGSSFVVVVNLRRTLVVAGEENALGLLSGVEEADLLDSRSLVETLGSLQPEPVGTARLAYADARDVVPAGTTFTTRSAVPGDVDMVLSSCTESERDESGVLAMDTNFVAVDSEGAPVAVSGYETWGDDVAHIGIAVAPERRGCGLGATVGYAAVRDALQHHHVVQWRSSVDNVASAHVGARLGFVELGTQVAVDLEV